MELNIEDYVGKIIDSLVIKLNNDTVIEVGGIKHYDTVYISEVKYVIMLITDIDTKVEHVVLLDTNNYVELMEDILKQRKLK